MNRRASSIIWRHSPKRDRPTRRGFTILEAQVAFVLLGIGLAGICPLVVLQLKISRVLARANIQSNESYTLNTYMKPAETLTPATTYLWPHPFDPENPDRTYFLVPETNAWYRRFGFAAALQMDPPAPLTALPAIPPYDVEFVSPPVFNGDSAALSVKVTKR